MPGFFLDTNVLLYSFDASDPLKRTRAREVLQNVRSRHSAAVSTQVLGEFFHVSRRKLVPPLSDAGAERAVRRFAQTWVVHPIQEQNVLEAVRGTRRHQLAYYDALIWATARLNGILTILTEDIQSAAAIEGVRFVNPFATAFDLATLTT